MAGERIVRRAIATSPLEQPPDIGTRRLDRGEVSRRSPRLELRCVACGYGAITAEPLPCPRCGGGVWDFAAWRPFSR
jgi:rubrerythrin